MDTAAFDKIICSHRIDTITHGLVDGAVGISGDKIAYVGSVSGAEKQRDAHTEYIDLGNAFLMPGLIDGHTHMMPYRESVDLSGAESLKECASLISRFHKDHPDLPLIAGHDWFAANWGGQLPSCRDVDSVLPDTPFFSGDMEMHMVWMNSAMMRRVGLSRETIDAFSKHRPQMVDVDSDGNPTGLVHDEVAMDVILKENVTPDADNVSKMFDVWSRYGVTSINDMDFLTADSVILSVIKELEQTGRLNVRVFSSLDASKASDESILQGQSFMSSDMFRLNALKAFLDGTGAGKTAFMLQPYAGTSSCGNSYRTLDELEGFIRLAARHGLATHFHACGDAAVRQALESYEWAKRSGIPLDMRSSIEHLDTAKPSDIERISRLGITVNLTPDFLAPTKRWKDNPYIKAYDEPVKNELFSLGSFIRTGMNVSFGTDGSASSMNPMDQLFRAVARVANDGEPAGGFRPEEGIRIDQALWCYTMGSAASIGMRDKVGSIETGKYADLAAFNTDFLTAEPTEIKRAKAVLTVQNGRVVWEA